MDVCRIGSPFEDDFIQTREIGDVCIAMIDERVLTDHQVEGAKARLSQLAEAHAGKLAISLANADGSSMGLFAALLQVQKYCQRFGGRMVLFNIPPRTSDALGAFGILDHFIQADDLEDALEALNGAGVPSRTSWIGQIFGFRRAAA